MVQLRRATHAMTSASGASECLGSAKIIEGQEKVNSI